MKLGVVGKGGVGKTTVAALLARAWRERGAQVLAIDTDSNPNLGLSLGLSVDDAQAVPVLPRSAVLGGGGDLTVDDVMRRYARPTPEGIALLSAMRVTEAGAGCTCGGHATVRSLLGEVLDARADVTIVDMEAGLEHLSRSGGTLANADVLLVVMEPSRKSVLTAARTLALARDLGLRQVLGVGNKVRDSEEAEFLERACAEVGIALAGTLPDTEVFAAAERDGVGLPDPLPAEVEDTIARLLDALGERAPA